MRVRRHGDVPAHDSPACSTTANQDLATRWGRRFRLLRTFQYPARRFRRFRGLVWRRFVCHRRSRPSGGAFLPYYIGTKMEMQIALLTAASRALAKITKRTEGPLRLQRQDAEKLL